MSKAFVRESDKDEDEDRAEEPQALPIGFKNYMTPQGHRELQEELRTLLRVERPKIVDVVSWAAGNGDRSENGDYIYGKRRLREIDRRIRFLSKRLEIAQVVDPTQQKLVANTRSNSPHRFRHAFPSGQIQWVEMVSLGKFARS